MARPRIKRKNPVVQSKKIINQNDDSHSFNKRRSSMRVNLSFVSNFSDSESTRRNDNNNDDDDDEDNGTTSGVTMRNGKKNAKLNIISEVSETPKSIENVTVIDRVNRRPLSGKNDANNVSKISGGTRNKRLNVIEEKELQLNKSCMQLKDAIMSKTRALFDDENELAIKTSEILSENSPETVEPESDEMRDQRTPSVRVNISKNVQVIMSGDGKKRNPVEVNAMSKQTVTLQRTCSNSSNNNDNMDCNQSIVSTPKKIRNSDKLSNSNKSSSRISDPMTNIPVARLFVGNTDPNRTVSDLNLVQSISSSKLNEQNEVENSKNDDTERSKNEELEKSKDKESERSKNEETQKSTNNESDKSVISDFLNQTSSPILSQGNRMSRFSQILKKKLTKTSTEESFLNKQPLVSSSLIEKRNDSNKNCNTINLEDSKNRTKTITIDSTSKSCMEITAISSQMPIIRRSFQNEIRKSLKLDDLDVSKSNNRNISEPMQTSTDPSKNSKKKSSLKVIEKDNKKGQSINDNQEDCSANTIRTSLNVNTSLDKISSVDSIAQKENKTPNNSNVTNTTIVASKNQTEENISDQHQNTFAVPLAKPKKSLINSTKSLITKKKHQMKRRSDKISDNQITMSSQEKESNKEISQRSSVNSNQEKEDDPVILSRQPSISTVRSSMQVNTSLDSVRKSPVVGNVLDFNKMATMIEEGTLSNENQSKESVYSTNIQPSDGESDQESVSLIERLRNISKTKKNNESKKISPKRKLITDSDCTKKKMRFSINKVTDTSVNKKSIHTTNNSPHNTRKSLGANCSRSLRTSRRSTRFGDRSNEASIVETTPYPTSRSVLLRTIIKNNIAMNTIDPRKFIDISDNDSDDNSDSNEENDNNCDMRTVIHKKTSKISKTKKSLPETRNIPSPQSVDTVLVDSSDESSSESEQNRQQVVIEESVNVTKVLDKSKNNKGKKDQSKNNQEKSKNKDKPRIKKKSSKIKSNSKSANKRKLYASRSNSLISFSPSDIQEIREEPEPVVKKRKTKKRKASLTQKPEIVDPRKPFISPELGHENEPEEILPQIPVIKKKPRKRLRKKIIIKKKNSTRALDNLPQNENNNYSLRLSQRDSLREFDLRKMFQKNKKRKNPRIVIVVTGLPRGDKDLVKSVIKALGSAELELNVTPRTTHVISSGVRTINLLKGILRGCWLMSLEWALKSLESGKWLDPNPYEMTHFAKAVQENRKDRQLFGKAYVPELFITSGLIYIDNGTSPPASVLKELVKIAGGRITEDPDLAEIEIGPDGLKENWILDSITTGEIQSINQYKQK